MFAVTFYNTKTKSMTVTIKGVSLYNKGYSRNNCMGVAEGNFLPPPPITHNLILFLILPPKLLILYYTQPPII